MSFIVGSLNRLIIAVTKPNTANAGSEVIAASMFKMIYSADL